MTLKGHDTIVNYACYSPALLDPNGQPINRIKIVAAADEGTVKIYDAKSGEEMLTLKGHTNWCLPCSPLISPISLALPHAHPHILPSLDSFNSLYINILPL